MSIQETFLKIKGIGKNERIALECLCLALILSVGFMAYWHFSLSAQDQSLPAAPEQAAQSESPMKLEIPDKPHPNPLLQGEGAAPATDPSASQGEEIGRAFVASKTGKVYYPASCKALNRIKPANRIYFSTEADARAKHLTLSKSCT